jgi:hypothetical protein
MALHRLMPFAARVMLAAAALWTWGCAARAAAVPVKFVPYNHVAAVGGAPEYDAVFYPGEEIDYYPDKEKPRRAVVHRGAGIAEFACLNDDCTDYTVRTSAIAGVADTSLELTEISKGILLVRDGGSGAVRGYLADAGANDYRFAETLDQAQRIVKGAHGDSTAMQVGKVALEVVEVTAIVAAMIALVAVGAAAGAAPP